MKKHIDSFLILLLLYGCKSPILSSEEIFKKVDAAVFTIYSKDEDGKIISQGSGVILNKNGWIVTNYHVYHSPFKKTKLVVKKKDKIIEETYIIGFNAVKDILILKVPEDMFSHIAISEFDSLNQGQKIYAIGSPMGFENTISEGIISGFRFNDINATKYIQISAPISHGSSGGAVVNEKGELIGITSSSVEAGQNLNFAIPVKEVMKIYNREGGNNEKRIQANEILHLGANEDDIHKQIELYKKACEVDTNFAKPYKYLASAYLSMVQRTSELHNVIVDSKDLERSISFYRRAISIDPNDADAYSGLGDVYNNKSRTADQGGVSLLDDNSAFVCFKKAIEIDPKSYDSYSRLGSYYEHNKKDLEGAISIYKNAIEIVSSNYKDGYHEWYFSIMTDYEELGKVNNAINYFKSLIEANPNNIYAYFYLGEAYYFRNEKYYDDTAIYYFRKGIEINNDDKDFFFKSSYGFLVRLYERKGDNYNAKLCYDKSDMK
jgi:tetratricopeptide (TPR) repeat protein